MTQISMQMLTSAVSDRGLSEKRPQNEDSYLEMPEVGMFAVADGVGGAQAGDVASQMAVEILAEAFNNLRENGDVEELMNIAITRANSAIYQMSHDLPQLSTMATTIVALQVSGNIATIGHVGDSRLYRIDSKGNLFRETQDHSVVEEEVRAGRMTPEQAENHPSKNVISRALGADSSVEIDMKTIMFEPGTTFLICSDGITRHISDVEIRELLELPHPPEIICGEMKQICYERGAEDNLTAVIVRMIAGESEKLTELEESTIATPRSTADTNSVGEEIHEIPTQNLSMPADSDDGEYESLADSLQETKPVRVPEYSTQGFNDGLHITASDSPAKEAVFERDEKTYVIDGPKTGNGMFGKIALFLVGLVCGILLGVLAYYLGSSKPAEPAPQLTEMQSPNIAFTSFESNRRLVDKNPSQYLDSSGQTVGDSEDFYLRGRAYMLLGKYPEARDAFAKAKDRLPDYKGESKSLLKNEIAIALSAINNGFSQKVLEADKATTTTVPASEGNSNK